MKPTSRQIADQPSWIIRNDQVELAITQLGGHMAPVTFYRDAAAPVQPYHVAPWHGEKLDIGEPVLRPLRGDFFCMPFGGGSIKGESHVAHGETATAIWTPADAARNGRVTSMTLTMRTRVRRGTVRKSIFLVDGQNVVYTSHELAGFSGFVPLGHHATLRMPPQERSVHLATSPILFGRTNPAPPGSPAEGEYYSIEPGRRFSSLRRVPLNFARPRYDDFTTFPARAGYCDLLAAFHRRNVFPAWTTAWYATEGYLWFSLKDPAVLPTLMMWVENLGRHGVPWLGRNNCLGLEDVCAYFATGLAPSLARNELNREGVPTSIKLSPKAPTAINYIQGVVKTPRGFGRVRRVKVSADAATFVGDSGRCVTATVNCDFLRTGRLV